MGTCLWVVWGVVGIEMGIGMLFTVLLTALQVTMAGDRIAFNIFYFGLNLLSAVIQIWLGIGMTRGLIKIVRGEPVSFDVVFSGGRYLLTTILASILVVVLFFAAGIIPILAVVATMFALRNQGSLAGGVIAVACFGLVLFLVVYLSARLKTFYYLIIDRDAGVIESIGLAWEISRGRVGTIIVVYLLQFVVILAGVLAVCVGLVFAIPFANLLMVVTYVALLGKPKPQEPTPFLRWEEDL